MRRFAPYRFEVIGLGFTLAVVGFLAIRGHPVRSSSLAYTLVTALKVLPGALCLGLVLHGYYHFWREGTLRPYLRRVVTPAWLIPWVRLWLACWVVSFGYFWLKVSVPLINGRTWDGALSRADRLLHFGLEPSRALSGLVSGTVIGGWLDRWYDLWLASVLWCIAFFAAALDDTLRRRVILSCALLWIAGALIYVAVPALGPVYAFDEAWTDLRGSMPRAEAVQDDLRRNHGAVLEVRGGASTAYDHRFGIAAMPSLHVGFHWLFALWAWRCYRVLFAPLAIATALTMVGSLATGWHYAVDGYVGAAAAWACYRIAMIVEAPAEGGALEKRCEPETG